MKGSVGATALAPLAQTSRAVHTPPAVVWKSDEKTSGTVGGTTDRSTAHHDTDRADVAQYSALSLQDSRHIYPYQLETSSSKPSVH